MKPYFLQCSYVITPHAVHAASGSIVPILSLVVLLFLYWFALLFHRFRGNRWSHWQTLSFSTGIFVLGIAFLPTMMQYAHHNFKGHMIQHLLIGMVAPIGLVLGAPMTLALKTLPRKKAWIISSLLGSRFFHILSHPVTTMLLNVGGMFVLYLTPLYAATFTNPTLHHLIHLHFLAAGYLFTWSMIGPDPAPRRPGLRLRVVVLFTSIAAHAYLSKMMYAYIIPRNTPHADDEIRSAAQLMYYGGDVTEILILIALFSVWYRKRNRPHYRLKSMDANN